MKTCIIIAVFSFFAPGCIFGFIDVLVEIDPSGSRIVSPFESELPAEHDGYHTKVNLKKQGDGKLLLRLPKVEGDHLDAWFVICKEARKPGILNFRQVHLPGADARKRDVELVVPVRFEKNGFANIQLTGDQASRSYIVFGGRHDDGASYTVNLPAFLKALGEQAEGERGGAEQPAAAPESELKSDAKSQPESDADGRSR